MTVLTVEGQKYYSADVVIEKRGDLFANGKPRSIFLNKKVEIDKEKDCLFFYLKEDKWVVTTPKYCKATVFFSGEWLKKMKIKVEEHIEVEIKEEVAKDIKPKRKHERIKPVHNLTFEQLMKGNAQETIKEVELTREQREKMVGLAYEKLTDKYYRVKYLNLDLIMDTEGYCNATNMCILGGKEFKNWKKTKSAKEYLNALQKEPFQLERLLHPVLYQVNSHDCNEVIRGTYVHPDLIVIIGMWISKEFGFKVQSIVKENILRESAYEMRRLNKLVDEEKSLREIAEEERQKAEAARQRAEEEYSKAEVERQKAEVARKESEKQRTAAMVILNRLEIKLTDVETTLDEQVDVTTQIKNVLEDTVDRNVPKNSNHAKKYENLYLVRKNQRHFYKLHRVQHLVEIPLEKGEEIICIVKDTPNSVNLGNAIKQRLLDLIPNIRIKNNIIDASDVECSSIENLENTLKNTCLSEHEKRVTAPLNKIPIAIDKRKKTRY